MIDLGRLKGELVAVDGHAVRPVEGSRFPIAMAQRLDVRLRLRRSARRTRSSRCWKASATAPASLLAAAGAKIARLGETAEKPAPALTFAFEQGLQATAPLSAKPADRVHSSI